MDISHYLGAFAHHRHPTHAIVITLALVVTVSLVMPGVMLGDDSATAGKNMDRSDSSQAVHHFLLHSEQEPGEESNKVQPTCVIYDELSRRARIDMECKARVEEGRGPAPAPAKVEPTCVIYDELSRRARIDMECKANVEEGQETEDKPGE